MRTRPRPNTRRLWTRVRNPNGLRSNRTRSKAVARAKKRSGAYIAIGASSSHLDRTFSDSGRPGAEAGKKSGVRSVIWLLLAAEGRTPLLVLLLLLPRSAKGLGVCTRSRTVPSPPPPFSSFCSFLSSFLALCLLFADSQCLPRRVSKDQVRPTPTLDSTPRATSLLFLAPLPLSPPTSTASTPSSPSRPAPLDLPPPPRQR